MNLEGFLNESLDGEPRGYGATFRKAVQALERAGVSFALAGSLAYSFHVEPTYTKDVDLLVDPDDWKKARAALRKAGFEIEGGEYLSRAVDPKTGVWIDLMFGAGDPEESARESAPKQTLFRTEVPIIGPGYMLWMYLLSDQGRHHDRALEIVRRRAADVGWLEQALRWDGDLDAVVKLRDLVAEARKPAVGWKPRERR
jgi:hypothetical protein